MQAAARYAQLLSFARLAAEDRVVDVRPSDHPVSPPTFEIARMMGTSIEQIEETYGHLLSDALERGRAALEEFDAREAAAAEI